ncbi:MAG: peptidoglycan-binding domain-containing protein [Verrucomicrobiota bacterium]
MKRSLLTLCLLALCGATLGQNAEITNVQNRLKTEGFYSGNSSGILDAETMGALRRYQIHHGLKISGKLDAPTTRELAASAAPARPPVLAGSWQRLPNGQMQFVPASVATSPAIAVKSLPSNPAPPPAEGPSAPVAGSSAATSSLRATNPPVQSSLSGGEIKAPEHFRYYVEAFVEAGLSQPLGSEIKFFAERVNYYGTTNVPRREIERDLVRYDRKWPHRQFWIDGDIQVQPQAGGVETKVVFPLRYELQNGARLASGKVVKTLTLLQTTSGEMQITAVSEWSAGISSGSTSY